MENRIELKEDDIGVGYDDSEWGCIYYHYLSFPIETKDQAEQLKKQILEDYEFRKQFNEMSLTDFDKHYLELKEKADLYLNERCGYCHEKMIVLGSRHIHACKHDLLNDDKPTLIEKNQQLESQVKELKETLDKQIEWNVLNSINITTAKQTKKELQKLQRFAESVNKEVDSWDIPDYGDFRYSKLKQLIEELK